jgi:tight adherence protein C
MNDSYPELSEEFRIANAEMNMGLPRSEALENLADRTGVREIQTLVATVIQAERFGSSIGKTLRVQSDSLRTKRQQAAEEAAGKTAVKLLIPLILFIFPALMIVVGGPAAITLIQNTSALE